MREMAQSAITTVTNEIAHQRACIDEMREYHADTSFAEARLSVLLQLLEDMHAPRHGGVADS